MSYGTYRPSVGGENGRSNVAKLLIALILGVLSRLEGTLAVARHGFAFGFNYGAEASPRRGLRRVVSGQGITGETQAVIAFFALLVIGTFVLGSIDTNLPTSGLDANYTSASNQSSGGFLDYVNLAVVLPVVVVGGLMLAVILRVF